MSIYDEIFADDKTYPDSAELTINGKAVKLGDIRDLTRKKQQELAAKLAEVQQEREGVKELATKAAALHQQLQDQVAAADKKPNVQVSDVDDFENDPLYAPIRKRLSPIEQTMKELGETQKKLATSLERAATIWFKERSADRFERVSDRLKKAGKDKDWNFDKVLEFAAKNNIVDANGLPDVVGAVTKLTAEDERKIIEQEAYERGLREGAQKGRMSNMTRPTSAAGAKAKPEDSAVGRTASLEHLGDDVAKDPELMDMLSQLGAIDPNEIVQ